MPVIERRCSHGTNLAYRITFQSDKDWKLPMKRTFDPTDFDLDRAGFNRHLDRLGLTQNELARRAGFRQKQTLSKIFNRDRRMTLVEFVKVLRVLGVPPDELLRVFGYTMLFRDARVTAGLTAHGKVDPVSSKHHMRVEVPTNAGEIGDIIFVDIRDGDCSYMYGSIIFVEPMHSAKMTDANRLAVIHAPELPEKILGVTYPCRAGQIMIRNTITQEEITTDSEVLIGPVIDWRFS